MNWKTQAGIAAGALAIIFTLGFIVKKQHDSITELKAIQSQMTDMVKLQDGTVRAQSGYASKEDIEKIINQSNIDRDLLQKDLDRLNANAQAVSTISATSSGSNLTNVPSTSTSPSVANNPLITCSDGEIYECPDEFGYRAYKQNLKLEEPFGDTKIPIGQVSFSASRAKPWDVKVLPRTYSVTSVLSQDEDGKHYIHNNFTIESDGKKYTIPIDSAKFVETYPQPEFRFTPRIYFGVDGGIIANPDPKSTWDIVPNAQIALFSYGRTKYDIDWTFLGIGGGYLTQNQKFALVLSPINYNLAKPIPLIDNLFIGPTISFDTSGDFGVLLGLRVGL